MAYYTLSYSYQYNTSLTATGSYASDMNSTSGNSSYSYLPPGIYVSYSVIGTNPQRLVTQSFSGVRRTREVTSDAILDYSMINGSELTWRNTVNHSFHLVSSTNFPENFIRTRTTVLGYEATATTAAATFLTECMETESLGGGYYYVKPRLDLYPVASHDATMTMTDTEINKDGLRFHLLYNSALGTFTKSYRESSSTVSFNNEVFSTDSAIANFSSSSLYGSTTRVTYSGNKNAPDVKVPVKNSISLSIETDGHVNMTESTLYTGEAVSFGNLNSNRTTWDNQFTYPVYDYNDKKLKKATISAYTTILNTELLYGDDVDIEINEELTAPQTYLNVQYVPNYFNNTASVKFESFINDPYLATFSMISSETTSVVTESSLTTSMWSTYTYTNYNSMELYGKQERVTSSVASYSLESVSMSGIVKTSMSEGNTSSYRKNVYAYSSESDISVSSSSIMSGATTYSTFYSTYSFSDSLLGTSTVTGMVSNSSSSQSTFTIEASSTVTSYDIASTYLDSGNYTFYTSYYGSIIGNNIDATSWIYTAEKSTTTFSSSDNLGYSYDMSSDSSKTIYGTTKSYNITSPSFITFVTFGNVAESTTKSAVDTNASKDIVFTTKATKSLYIKGSSSETLTSRGFINATTSRFSDIYATGSTQVMNGLISYNSIFNGSMIYTTESIRVVTNSALNTEYNTLNYGSTLRLSSLISSSSRVNLTNGRATQYYDYSYSVSSMWTCVNDGDEYKSTISEYSTHLGTSYIASYNISAEYGDYYATKSTSLAVKSTGERFIDRVEISRTFTSNYYVTYTVAIYNYSNIGTVSSSTSLGYTQSEQDASTVARTFISSTADLATTSEIASSTTATSARGSFIYSSREFISSMTEQQNDTLIFASTFNTYSFYNSTYTTSTLNTVASTLSATTYEDWYNPVSWTSTALSVATATSVAQTVNTTSGIVSVTQSVNYTPVYEDVDGIYITTN